MTDVLWLIALVVLVVLQHVERKTWDEDRRRLIAAALADRPRAAASIIPQPDRPKQEPRPKPIGL